MAGRVRTYPAARRRTWWLVLPVAIAASPGCSGKAERQRLGGGAGHDAVGGSSGTATGGASPGAGVPGGGTAAATGGASAAGASSGRPDHERGGGGGEAGGGNGNSGGTEQAGAGGVEECANPLEPGCFTCCEPAICPKGFADCDDDPRDCETAFGANGSCTPQRSGAPPPSFGTPVINDDGSYFVSGPFFGSTDFDPGPDEDIRTPVGDDAYVSAYSAAGGYLWTHTFRRGVYAFNVASGADGSAYVAGSFIRDTLRNPDAPPEEVFTDAFILRLGAEGDVLWEGIFDAVSTGAGSGAQVTSDGAGNAIVQIGLSGDVDFDPTAGVDVRHFGPYGQGYLMEFDPDGSRGSARAVGDGSCVFFAMLMNASRSVTAMHASANLGCLIDGKPITSTRRGYGAVLVFTREGALRDLWMLGGLRALSSVLAYDDGSVVIAGDFAGELRLGDPGDVIATEQQGGSDFVLRFSKDSRLEWVKVVPPGGWLGPSVARAPNGGVLGSLFLQDGSRAETSLVSWNADGTPRWTGGLGCRMPPLIVSNGGWFMLKSNDPDGSCDLEPGVTEPPADGSPYLARYRF